MKYEYWFANIVKLNGTKKYNIRAMVTNAKELYYIEETKLKSYGVEEKDIKIIRESKRMWNLNAEYESFCEKKIRFYTMFHPSYPQKLKDIPSPPYAIYVKGELPDPNQLAVSIVGARECSTYGREMASWFGRELAHVGIQVVSGMARGIDGAGQWGALEAGGNVYGVLACGVDVCYPRDNIELYAALEKRGGIISEQGPGTKPLARYFPARNRIISGLSDVVLVMEAKEKSGSLITADMALEQGKDVYALPGPITSRLSGGSNRLIKQGAGILISPEDFLEELSIPYKQNVKNVLENENALETQENIVYSCLGLYPKSVSQICNETGLTVPEIIGVLVALELKGYIHEISKNYYTRLK